MKWFSDWLEGSHLRYGATAAIGFFIGYLAGTFIATHQVRELIGPIVGAVAAVPVLAWIHSRLPGRRRNER